MTEMIIIGIYLALLLGLGIFASTLFKGTSKDYMLASHSIGPFLLLMSIFGTTMTAFALVGSSGEAFRRRHWCLRHARLFLRNCALPLLFSAGSEALVSWPQIWIHNSGSILPGST